MPVENLRSGNRLEDRELQKRIDARRFPTIHGVLTTMRRRRPTTRYRVHGDLKFRGVTKAIEDEMTVELVDGDTPSGSRRVDVRHPRLRDGAAADPLLRVEPDVNVSVDIVASGSTATAKED